MSGRSRPGPHLMKGPLPPLHSSPPPFGHSLGLGPDSLPSHYLRHHVLLDEMHDGPPPFSGGVRGSRPIPPALFEERLAAQHQEIQGLLLNNQRLVATHVALKQELAAAQHELQCVSHASGALQAVRDAELREGFDKSMKMEAELRAAEATMADLISVRGEIQKLNAGRRDLTTQVQMLTQDLARASAELQEAPTIKAEVEAMKHEVQRVRDAIEYEKKGYAENYEQGQMIEKNLILMAREVEKLRAEIANTKKRARAVLATENQGIVGNYGNPDSSFVGNPYPSGYGMNPVPGGADTGAQYGAASGPAHGSWSAYDMHRAHVWG